MTKWLDKKEASKAAKQIVGYVFLVNYETFCVYAARKDFCWFRGVNSVGTRREFNINELLESQRLHKESLDSKTTTNLDARGELPVWNNWWECDLELATKKAAYIEEEYFEIQPE